MLLFFVVYAKKKKKMLNGLDDDDFSPTPLSASCSSSFAARPLSARPLSTSLSSSMSSSLLTCVRCNKLVMSDGGGRIEETQSVEDHKLSCSHDPLPQKTRSDQISRRTIFRSQSVIGGANNAFVAAQGIMGAQDNMLLPFHQCVVGGGGVRAIDPATVADIFEGKFPDVSRRKFVFVDCRFPYEYHGGHVKGAINLQLSEIKPHFFTRKLKDLVLGCETPVLIFYCEFSSQRGPKTYHWIRDLDRKMNNYPKLHYPQIYLLKKGYSNFWEHCPNHCEPRSYLPMNDPLYATEMASGIKANRLYWQNKGDH